jgi:hypothetical protein
MMNGGRALGSKGIVGPVPGREQSARDSGFGTVAGGRTRDSGLGRDTWLVNDVV